ncbi:MAG TPA: S1 RNA-binding domain-containing protein, partial [Vicinamibacterales bacterium]|nr:S1 RNA-binding domain-containing protein [Vicinamibacterales bacterium]
MSEQEEDFATLFEASVKKARQFGRGQAVEGTIVSIGPKVAFVNIGGKGEAELDVAELKDEEGDIEVSVGDRISAIVVSTSGGVVLSRKGVRNAATHRELEDAYQSGVAVEGKVVQAIKGGYEVRVARERAFCPLSQIDIARTTDPELHVGKSYAFRVIEYKNGGKDIVLSRRKLLEQQQEAQAADLRKSIVAGAILSGRVASVLDFGAFVDLGGVQGLLHVSEMSWTRIGSPAEIVAPGDQITVKVLRVDEATGKIALGLKQLQGDPWVAAATGYAAGQLRSGRVSRIADFGVFVELEPGIEALLPAAETGLDRDADLRRA